MTKETLASYPHQQVFALTQISNNNCTPSLSIFPLMLVMISLRLDSISSINRIVAQLSVGDLPLDAIFLVILEKHMIEVGRKIRELVMSEFLFSILNLAIRFTSNRQHSPWKEIHTSTRSKAVDSKVIHERTKMCIYIVHLRC